MSHTNEAIRSACTAQATYRSPLGPLLLVRTARGLAGAWFDAQKHHPLAFDAPERPGDPVLARAAAQFDAYFAGHATDFDMPLDLQGTAFQLAVWQALLAIARGATSTYGQVARAIGNPVALRAVGSAIGRNPLSVIVPCHRVIGSDGSLTGYAGGMHRKVALLELEGVRAGPQTAALTFAEAE